MWTESLEILDSYETLLTEEEMDLTLMKKKTKGRFVYYMFMGTFHIDVYNNRNHLIHHSITMSYCGLQSYCKHLKDMGYFDDGWTAVISIY